MSANTEKAIQEHIAHTLDNLKIEEHKTAEAPKTVDEAVNLSASEGRRLYIGNLAYATLEDELKEFFNSYNVESVSIPKNPRTDRPVGYAFVDLQTAEDAERAILELSGKEILERKVSVQHARKPEAFGDRGEGSNGEFADGTRRRPSGRGRGGRGRGRGGGGRGGRFSDEALPRYFAAKDTLSPEGHPLGDITNQTMDDGPKGLKNSARVRKERGPPADGIPSRTKVMVANLPYDLSEEKLKELFVDYEPQAAKIALRPIPRFMIKKLLARGEARKGRGFGFVTLLSEEMQQKAVQEMNGKTIEGREIAVKVAIDSPGKTDDEVLNNQGENEEAGTVAADGTNGDAPPVSEPAATAVAEAAVPAAA